MEIAKLHTLLIKKWYGDTSDILEPIHESTNNLVYGYGDFIIKTNNSWSSLENEYRVLSRLSDPVFPKACAFFRDEEDVLILERLSGKWIEYSWKSLTDAQKMEILHQIVNKIQKIHNTICDQVDIRQVLRQEFDRLLLSVWENPHLSYEEKGQLVMVFEKALLSAEFKNVWYIHHDIWYKNILVENGKLTGIIDFETAQVRPLCFELFRILHHRLSAQNYIDSWAVDYTEMEFLEWLILALKSHYSEIFDFWLEDLLVYNLLLVLKMFGKHRESWYNHVDVMRLKTKIIDNIDQFIIDSQTRNVS